MALLVKMQASMQIFFSIYVAIIQNPSTAKSAMCKLQPESKAVSVWNKSVHPPITNEL